MQSIVQCVYQLFSCIWTILDCETLFPTSLFMERKTYCLCKGRTVVSCCRGTQWGQTLHRAGVQTQRQQCSRSWGQSERWTDHTWFLRTGYSVGSSVCPYQPCRDKSHYSVHVTCDDHNLMIHLKINICIGYLWFLNCWISTHALLKM